MMLVSHRGPHRFSAGEDGTFDAVQGSGGLVSAVLPLLHGGSGSELDEREAWVAAAIDDGDRAAVAAGAAHVPGLELHLLALDPELHALHYDTISNATLWFLHHGLFDLTSEPVFDDEFRVAWDAYRSVNQTFADAVIADAHGGETVLVHDYQLALVPGLVRAARPDLALCHFTHTPFCGPDAIRILPDDVARAICGSMGSVPAGFHTARWADRFALSVHEVSGGAPGGGTFAAPLGPDVEALRTIGASEEAAIAATSLDEVVGDRLLILRSDRLDPAKNIARGFLAYDALLTSHPEWRERVVFVAMLNVSREKLPQYSAYRDLVERTAQDVNDRWATPDWQPIVLDQRDDYARSIAGFQRYDVLVVNSLKDGLNLVAKEGPLLNRRDGVLCLSPETGAYDDLRQAAVTMHPFDVEQGGHALHEALELATGDPDERAARATQLCELAALHTPRTWLDAQLAHAR